MDDEDYKEIMSFLEHIDLREDIINNTLYYWYKNEPEEGGKNESVL